MKDLPVPACKHGYTRIQLELIFGNKLEDFNKWMYGQTCMLCNAKEYDIELDQEVPSGCKEPHGVITYSCDVEQYLNGLDPLD